MGIADWLINEITMLDVDVRLNSYAEAENIIAEKADTVIIATGGWPELPEMELLTSSWEVLTGEVRVSGDVLLLDDVGDHSAAVCANVMAKSDCRVTIVTPDRTIAHDLGPTNSSVVLRDLVKLGVEFDCFLECVNVEADGNRKMATLRHVLTGELTERIVDYIVVENGTKPMDDVYHDLKQASRNHGQLDHQAMIDGRSPFVDTNTIGQFNLARIGDAIASRNIHAALYDA